MIKIKRISAPVQLTKEVKKKLTDEFKANNKKSVWRQPYIRENLLAMSNCKCCYCEEIIGDSCREMHIDHYHDKSTYPDEVVDWENLLPSCAYCNKKKSKHDTYTEPIINPTIQDPRDIFFIKNYRYCSRDNSPNSLGKTTIDLLGLNDSNEKVLLRFKIGNSLNEALDKLYNDVVELGDSIRSNTRKRNNIIHDCLNKLKLCTKTSRFGATMATVLHENESYQLLRAYLIDLGLWDDELEALHNEAKEICLCK